MRHSNSETRSALKARTINAASILVISLCATFLVSCPALQEPLSGQVDVIYLHHSTGGDIWNGGVPEALAAYSAENGFDYRISEIAFPKNNPYGWNNYPYDNWNIWVNHAGLEEYMEEPTLEILTRTYEVISFKHCFPVSNIGPDTGSVNVASAEKKAENYKLQYNALKAKMRQFPNTRFIVWTGAANWPGATNEDEANRARAFFQWVKEDWDEKGDNIYVWDFFELETGGGLYLLPENGNYEDSHPNSTFSAVAAPLFVKRLVDVIEGRGDTGSLTGR